MPHVSFDKYFKQIDEIQSSVYDDIYRIESLHESLEESKSFDTTRDRLCRDSTSKILRMSSILEGLGVLIQQAIPSLRSFQNIDETYTLYQEKIAHLKERLKESQLTAYHHEGGLIHKQRIVEFIKPKESQSLGTKEDLFAGRSKDTGDTSERPVDEQILTHNKNISNSLKLTKQLMTMSVMQTELNIETLDQQTRDVSTLNDKLVDLESVLNKSRQIVKFIEKQDKKDKRRIYLSIGFLLLCCAWVVWHRILKLPVKIMLWTFMRFFGILGWFTKAVPKKASVEFYSTVDPLVISHGSSISTAEPIISGNEFSSLSNLHTETYTTSSTVPEISLDARFESWQDYTHDEL